MLLLVLFFKKNVLLLVFFFKKNVLLLVLFFKKIVLLLVFFFKKMCSCSCFFQKIVLFFFVLSVNAFRLGMGLFYGISGNPVNHSRLPHIEYKSFLDNIIIRGFGKL